jgi:hypothetical protein
MRDTGNTAAATTRGTGPRIAGTLGTAFALMFVAGAFTYRAGDGAAARAIDDASRSAPLAGKTAARSSTYATTASVST